MAKGAKKASNGETNPELEERKRLKQLAHSKHLLSSAPAKDFAPLAPSKTLVKHHGADILKKSQRKNRYLFSFPGLLAPVSGGKIGELTNLGSKNPTLYLDFPQGRMKLFGTIVYPDNRYLSLQFSKGGKSVLCEDYFDTMIVFSEACWVGSKDENPHENKLPFPVELYENSSSDYDFQGGAGGGAAAAAMENQSYSKAIKKPAAAAAAEEEDTDTDMEALSPAREENTKKSADVTPVRHSERNAGKRFKFVDVSSGEDSPVVADEESSGSEESDINNTTAPFKDQDVDLDVEMKDNLCEVAPAETGKIKPQRPQSDVSVSSSTKCPQKGSGRLVQSSISTMLKKAATKIKQTPNVKKKVTSSVKEKVPSADKAGPRSTTKKLFEISDESGSDAIEEFSSPSQVSDEDWA